jgi:hypothetical protein
MEIFVVLLWGIGQQYLLIYIYLSDNAFNYGDFCCSFMGQCLLRVPYEFHNNLRCFFKICLVLIDSVYVWWISHI